MKSLAIALVLVAAPGAVAAAPPLLLQRPTLSKDTIAFDFAGEVWTVARTGGPARRLVAGQGRNFGPVFSPDGTRIAFTGTYDENADVYVVPASGGEPTRLTYHPGQLERAVEVVLEQLKAKPPARFVRPPYPDYKQRLPKNP